MRISRKITILLSFFSIMDILMLLFLVTDKLYVLHYFGVLTGINNDTEDVVGVFETRSLVRQLP